MAYKYIALIVICLFGLSAKGQYKSPFNNKEIKVDGPQYSFIVSGHFYGDGGQNFVLKNKLELYCRLIQMQKYCMKILMHTKEWRQT